MKTSTVTYSWADEPPAAVSDTSASGIDVYRNYGEFSERPTREYDVVAKLSASESTGDGAGRPLSTVISGMRTEAAGHGCEALIVNAAEQFPDTYNPGGTGDQLQELWEVVADCIRYRDAAPAGQPEDPTGDEQADESASTEPAASPIPTGSED